MTYHPNRLRCWTAVLETHKLISDIASLPGIVVKPGVNGRGLVHPWGDNLFQSGIEFLFGGRN
jgi:hypothetical protein